MYNNLLLLLLLGGGHGGGGLGLLGLDSHSLKLGLGHGFLEKRKRKVLAVLSRSVVGVRLHHESAEGESCVSGVGGE